MLALPLALVLSLGVAPQVPQEPLGVLRATPQGVALARAEIQVTFDRPVAGDLSATIDPATIFSIEPAVAGRLEWRDPVTIRFRPAAPLKQLATFTVTIANTFAAMDGSRLESPYRFSFRVKGPVALAGWPAGSSDEAAEYLALDQHFQLLIGTHAPDDPALDALLATASVEFTAACRTGPIRLRRMMLRELASQDPYTFRQFIWEEPWRGAFPALRVAEMEPERPLPRGCQGYLRVQSSVDDPQAAAHRWRLSTYGDFVLKSVACGQMDGCPTGPLQLNFSTPVRGAELLRHVKVAPGVSFSVADTAWETASWTLDAEFAPRTSYAVILDSELTDIFGQRLEGNRVAAFRTTGYAPFVSYPQGRWLVERKGPRSLAVQHTNVDTLLVMVARVPDSLEARILADRPWEWEPLLEQIAPTTAQRSVPVSSETDQSFVTGVRLPAQDARRPESSTLLAVKISSPRLDPRERPHRPIALLQVTDLALHTRFGAGGGTVWVTGVSDGLPRPGAAVTVYSPTGAVLATGQTDEAGLARFPGVEAGSERGWYGFKGYAAAALEDDRAVVALDSESLSPWEFEVYPAWGADRELRAGTLFTERDIYRPGEPVHAKAIVRRGPLGGLSAPPAGESLRWIFRDREDEVLKDTVVSLSEFGTADQKLDLPVDFPLGYYSVEVQMKEGAVWQTAASTSYRVAEYRPPEFLVDLRAPAAAGFAGDSARLGVDARYLFGAPMARAAVSWSARRGAGFLEIPGTEGFYLGSYEDYPGDVVFAQGSDTLDAAGHLDLAIVLPVPPAGRPGQVTVEATVTDVNRQAVSGSASLLVHPAAFYIGARPEGREYFWRAGEPQRVAVVAVRPDGTRVSGVAVTGEVVRREWHQVTRRRGAYSEIMGEWVAETVAGCSLVTQAEPVPCEITPPGSGMYTITLTARDAAGHLAMTRFYRWVVGPDWVPWYDETRFKMDVIADRERYSVGDTATILFASPFTDAEAWIAVEREGIIEERRLRITTSATTLKLPISEAFVPNVYVSIIVVRGRSAPPGPPDDPGRPTLRVGYAQLRVTPEVKRLSVDVRPLESEYRPGDTARVELQVRDARGVGQRSEVTLWAVDEGVLALTGFRTPDPLDGIYRERGLGVGLSSNLVAVAEQVAAELLEQARAKGEPGGGGGMDVAGILRSRFRFTAFFLGSVVTDANGRAVAAAGLPDNLTTFRVMAVAVTKGDRYGSGESSLLVTRPLVARPALPRFLRPGDAFSAGVVVNHRLGGTPSVKVEAEAHDVTLLDRATQTVRLEAGRGREVRFDFRAVDADSATFRFKVSSGAEADAVQLRLKIRPEFHPRAHTLAGALYDSDLARLELPADIDPDRSQLEISYGASPMAIVRGLREDLRVYPYYCSEQIASVAIPLIALYRAQRELGDTLLAGDPRAEIASAVDLLTRRQRADGSIGFWSAEGWSNPWITAYAGEVLVAARELGVPVKDDVLARLGDYLQATLRQGLAERTPLERWYRHDSRLSLADAVAAVDVLRRLNRPDVATENTLYRQAAQLSWEDRLRLADVLARRGDRTARSLLESAWPQVKVEGRRAVLPDSAHAAYFYFPSSTRATARLLIATLHVEPTHPLVGPLVETLAQQRQALGRWYWTTQDQAFIALALAEYEKLRRQAPERRVRIAHGERVLDEATPSGRAGRAKTLPLSGLLQATPDGKQALEVTLTASGERGEGLPVFYYLTVHEVPRQPPVRPGDSGIQVERWYERYDDATPITGAAAGDLVRVRLRITVPAERYFFVLDDALPAGLEAVDLSLRTTETLPAAAEEGRGEEEEGRTPYGSWYYGYWSPFDHRELRDDRVVYSATVLWPGTYYATYVARATTSGTFLRPPAHAEEMYNPGVNGRSDGGTFSVSEGQR